MSTSRNDQINQVLSDVVYNVGRVLDSKFTSDVTISNAELDAMSLQLGGLSIRKKSINISEYNSTKNYFEGLGIGKETAATFAMVVINLSHYSDQNVTEIIDGLEERGIKFMRQQYDRVNTMRKSTSRLYSWIAVDNCNDTYINNKIGLYCKPYEPPESN